MASTTIHSLVYKVISDSSGFTKGMVATRSELSAAKKLAMETRTPLEQLGNSFGALDKLWEKGAITADVYTRSANRLTAEYEASTPAALEAAAAAEQHAKAMERGAQVADQLSTPMERHAKRLEELDGLLKQGAISEELYGRGVARAGEELSKATGQAAALAQQIDRGRAVFDGTRSPLEKYTAGLQELDALLKAGAIDQETFNRAVGQSTSKAAKELGVAPETVKSLPSVKSLGIASETPAPSPDAAAIDKAREALEAQNAAMERAAQLERELQTPQEAHAKRMAQLDDLLQRGAISEGLYGRAVERANKDLSQASGEAERTAMAEAELNRTVERGKQVFSETRTGMEKYQADLKELDDLLKKGAIDQETFNRAAAKSAKSNAGSPFKPDAKPKDAFTGIDQAIGGTPLAGVGNMTKMLGAMGPAAIAAGAALAGVAAGAAIIKTTFDIVVPAVNRAMERIDATVKTADRLGVTTEALTGLRYAAEASGVGADELDGALEKLNVNIGKAAREGDEGGKAFQRIGLDAKALANERPDEAFMQVVDALGAIENPAQRAAAAVEIFGKGNQKLINLALGGSEAIKAARAEAELFGQVINGVDARTIERTNDNFERINKAVDGAANALAVELAPVMEFVTGLIVDQIKEWGGVKQAVSDFVDFAVKDIAMLIDSVGFMVPGLKAAAEFLTGKEFSGDAFIKGWEDMKAASRAASEEFAKGQAAQAGYKDELAKTEALDTFLGKLEEQKAALEGAKEDLGLQKLKDMELDPEQIEKATQALKEFNEAKLAKEASDDARKLEEAMQRELEALKGISEEKQKIADLDKRGVDTSRLTELEKEIEKEKRKKQLAEETAKARDAAEKQAEQEKKDLRSFVDKVADSGKSDQQKLADKLQEDVAKLQQAKDAGVIDQAEQDKLDEQLRTQFDKDMASAKGGGQKVATDNRAAARGSAEAFSLINKASQAGLGGNSNPNAKVEANTAKTAAATVDVKEAVKQLAENLKNQQGAAF